VIVGSAMGGSSRDLRERSVERLIGKGFGSRRLPVRGRQAQPTSDSSTSTCYLLLVCIGDESFGWRLKTNTGDAPRRGSALPHVHFAIDDISRRWRAMSQCADVALCLLHCAAPACNEWAGLPPGATAASRATRFRCVSSRQDAGRLPDRRPEEWDLLGCQLGPASASFERLQLRS